MIVAVLSDDSFFAQLAPVRDSGHRLIRVDSLRSLCMVEADLYIDAEFQPERTRIAALLRLPGSVLLRGDAAAGDLPLFHIQHWPESPDAGEVLLAGRGSGPEELRRLLEELGGWKVRFRRTPDLKAIAPLILGIDTAQQRAILSLFRGQTPLGSRENGQQSGHASWIHTAIRDLLQELALSPGDLDAVGVTIGPGSYTGLRVGLATAKGLCYALGIPLLTESSLRLIARAARRDRPAMDEPAPPLLLVPMIDARRMEVFTAIYNEDLSLREGPEARILNAGCYDAVLEQFRLLFCGEGAEKWKPICEHGRALFSNRNAGSADLAETFLEKYREGAFSDLAYTAPDYVKAANTGPSHK